MRSFATGFRLDGVNVRTRIVNCKTQTKNHIEKVKGALYRLGKYSCINI